MPVIQLSLAKLSQYCKKKVGEKKILDALPYIGLDIEDQEGDIVTVEYSPNRPDFSSEVGIARSLVGILGIETGAPKYSFLPSSFRVSVSNDEITLVRPYIHALYAEIPVTEETIKQLITMQEDLHNGIGRKRAKVAIGIHNAEVISNRIVYHVQKNRNFSFAPLDSKEKRTIGEILEATEQGISYGKLLSNAFPILEDSSGNVLSMPPIINGDLTRLAAGQSRLFVDITGTDERVVDVSSAIIASMLSDSGGNVFTVEIQESQGSVLTPDMTPKSMRFDLELSRDVMGYDFTMKEAETFLGRSRIGMYSNGNAVIPRYRYDIIHPIDLVEEIALGFGIEQIKPQSLKTSLAGSFSKRQKKLDRVIEALVGLGLTEVWNLSLTSAGQASEGSLKVDDSKSQSFEYLRREIVPSLLSVLGSSTHQQYPQKIFEQAPIFIRSSQTVSSVAEEEHVAVMIADSEANYTIIRSVFDALLKLILEEDASVSFRSSVDDKSAFAPRRSAVVTIRNKELQNVDIGTVGEIAPLILERYGLRVPVAGFEINLEHLIKE